MKKIKRKRYYHFYKKVRAIVRTVTKILLKNLKKLSRNVNLIDNFIILCRNFTSDSCNSCNFYKT